MRDLEEPSLPHVGRRTGLKPHEDSKELVRVRVNGTYERRFNFFGEDES